MTQVAEYISEEPLSEWTKLEDVCEYTFSDDIKYNIVNNGATSIRYCVCNDTPTFFGITFRNCDQIWYKKEAGTLWIKGSNFNLAISEV